MSEKIKLEIASHRRLLWQLLNGVGMVIFAFSIVFVAWKIYATSLWKMTDIDPVLLSLLLIVVSFLYGLNLLFLSTGWGGWLIWLGECERATLMHHVIYARSQIAKYLPGNVFHVVNRQILGRQAGIQHASLAVSTVCEILSLLFASASIALLTADSLDLFPGHYPFMAMIGIPLILGALLCMPQLVRFSMKKKDMLGRSPILQQTYPEIISRLCLNLSYYVLFFLVAGILAVNVMFIFEPAITLHNIGAPFSIFALSWAVGFITPGAPAGVGVREATMIIALEPIFGDNQSLLFALSLRVMTLAGDTFFFLGSLLLPRFIPIDVVPISRAGSGLGSKRV